MDTYYMMGDLRMCEYLISLIKPAIPSILGTIVGGFIGVWAGRKNIEKSHQLVIDDKILKLKNQLQYLIELYNNHLRVYSELNRTQDDIDSAVWEPDIFIFETNYKDDLLYTDLTEIEKQKVLSWFHQWEIINKVMTDYLMTVRSTKAFAGTILKEKCIKQNERLEQLLPDIEKIIRKLEK